MTTVGKKPGRAKWSDEKATSRHALSDGDVIIVIKGGKKE